jgi:hypothetical protein
VVKSFLFLLFISFYSFNGNAQAREVSPHFEPEANSHQGSEPKNATSHNFASTNATEYQEVSHINSTNYNVDLDFEVSTDLEKSALLANEQGEDSQDNPNPTETSSMDEIISYPTLKAFMAASLHILNQNEDIPIIIGYVKDLNKNFILSKKEMGRWYLLSSYEFKNEHGFSIKEHLAISSASSVYFDKKVYTTVFIRSLDLDTHYSSLIKLSADKLPIKALKSLHNSPYIFLENTINNEVSPLLVSVMGYKPLYYVDEKSQEDLLQSKKETPFKPSNFFSQESEKTEENMALLEYIDFYYTHKKGYKSFSQEAYIELFAQRLGLSDLEAQEVLKVMIDFYKEIPRKPNALPSPKPSTFVGSALSVALGSTALYGLYKGYHYLSKNWFSKKKASLARKSLTSPTSPRPPKSPGFAPSKPRSGAPQEVGFPPRAPGETGLKEKSKAQTILAQIKEGLSSCKGILLTLYPNEAVLPHNPLEETLPLEVIKEALKINEAETLTIQEILIFLSALERAASHALELPLEEVENLRYILLELLEKVDQKIYLLKQSLQNEKKDESILKKLIELIKNFKLKKPLSEEKLRDLANVIIKSEGEKGLSQLDNELQKKILKFLEELGFTNRMEALTIKRDVLTSLISSLQE